MKESRVRRGEEVVKGGGMSDERMWTTREDKKRWKENLMSKISLRHR